MFVFAAQTCSPGRSRPYCFAEQRLSQLRRRLEQACIDCLHGKITEEFWEAKSAEWQKEEQALLASL